MRSLSRSHVLVLSIVTLAAAGCAHSSGMTASESPAPAAAPNPDPRVGLKGGLWDAAQALWNLSLVSATKPTDAFVGKTNSDLAFLGNYVIQGSYNGFQVWDISNASQPTLKVAFVCPASQSDVSVYKNLLFISAEAPAARLDCGLDPVKDTVSTERIRGLRIFDITDITHPRNVANVQTCRGSHTHTLLVDPKDPANVYIYISGSSFVRSATGFAGCVKLPPTEDPSSALFRIEVIKVPLAHPEQAAIVSSPRIFNNLENAARHGLTAEDRAAIADAKAHGAFTMMMGGQEMILGNGFVNAQLDSIVKARGGSGAPTAADSAALRASLPTLAGRMGGNRTLGTSCHDITVYPQLGLAGGACEGHGLLLDISDPAHPTRLDAVADSNFSYWHSATFNNDGTKILFSDEWGGGAQPKCRASDPRDWGADAIFTIENRKMVFQSYYKLPAPQTKYENCVAHNGSLIPIPGRDIMVQGWYQGGISVFDWTDPKHPTEIAYFDRGPIDSTRLITGGSWSAYWYNGLIVSSEIARGLDILQLTPSPWISQNEIDAAKSVRFDEFNTQGQPSLAWPASFAVAGAYVDQLARSKGLGGGKIASIRAALAHAQQESGAIQREALVDLAQKIEGYAAGAGDPAKVKALATATRNLATASLASASN